MKNYPKLNKNGSGSLSRKSCHICRKSFNKDFKGRFKIVCIEWNWFRGDDTVLKVCHECCKELTLDDAIDFVESENIA